VEQEFALGRNALRPGERAGDFRQTGGGRTVKRTPQEIEGTHTVGAWHEAGIGDGVGRPGQQVGETSGPRSDEGGYRAQRGTTG